MYRLLSEIFMGWSLGANDSANIFGTAVFAKKIRYRTAVLLCGAFVLIGAFLEGRRGMYTLGGLVAQTADSAFAASLGALTVTIMSVLKLPVSTSQAIIGSVLGIGIYKGVQTVKLRTLLTILFGWIGTPALALAFSFLLFRFVFL